MRSSELTSSVLPFVAGLISVLVSIITLIISKYEKKIQMAQKEFDRLSELNKMMEVNICFNEEEIKRIAERLSPAEQKKIYNGLKEINKSLKIEIRDGNIEIIKTNKDVAVMLDSLSRAAERIS